ncbi:MAG: hypothetical protein JWQ29_2371 [Phenylobacterium sp.]|nr:hypothetical protein [Phenylobacterium sp.]
MPPILEITEAAIQRTMIENTLNRYAWAYDFDEFDQIGECFARDAEVEFGGTGLKIGREAVVAELARRRARYRPEGDTPWHICSNVYVRPVSSTRAVVASWYTFGTKKRDEPLTGTGLDSFGWYDDTFVLEDGEWRIATRRILRPGQR